MQELPLARIKKIMKLDEDVKVKVTGPVIKLAPLCHVLTPKSCLSHTLASNIALETRVSRAHRGRSFLILSVLSLLLKSVTLLVSFDLSCCGIECVLFGS